MGDHHGTEPFKSYEPSAEAGYDYDYDYEDRRSPGRVLWGRVIVLAVVLVLAFLIGRATAPEGSSDQVEDLQERLASANAQLEELQEQPASPEATPTAEPTQTAAAQQEGINYTVQEGDTLASIAEEHCGDPSLDEVLKQANDISNPETLRTGDEIVIPADCGE